MTGVDKNILNEIKIEIRETQAPYFEDAEIEHYFKKNNGDKNATIYELLIIKSEDSTISVSGLSTHDTSGYFKRLASKYRSYNSGILSGV